MAVLVIGAPAQAAQNRRPLLSPVKGHKNTDYERIRFNVFTFGFATILVNIHDKPSMSSYKRRILVSNS